MSARLPYVQVYFDNLVFITRQGELPAHVDSYRTREVFEVLREHRISISRPSSTFAATSMRLLGFTVSREGGCGR